MPDVTISNLAKGTPTGNYLVPISNGTDTICAALSDFQVNYNSLVSKPTIVQSIAQVIFNNDNGTTSLANGAGYLSTNITILAGSKVLIDARITMSGSGGDVFNVSLQRNGSNIDNATNDSYGFTENVTFSVLDNPGAGTHTYRFYNQSGGARNINRDRSGNNPCYSTIRLTEIRGI